MPQKTTPPTKNPKDTVAQPDAEKPTAYLKVAITYIIAGISLISAFMAWWATDIDPAKF